MFRSFIIGASMLCAVGVAAPAMAQSSVPRFTRTAPAAPAAGAGLSAVAPGPRPLFTIGGFNGVIDAPVEAPNSGIAYRTYQGQPMTGRDAILGSAPGAHGP